jgi:outer membrane putative beta-barrel porin/alpha-amylase
MHLNPVASAVALAVLAAPAIAPAEEGPIQDNSFLVEEAYNQEPGVIQHISSFTRARAGSWAYSFTEEWPVLGQTHQASVTFNYAGLQPSSARGMGDVALNYRLQAVGNGETPVAFAPRLTAILPTGDAARGLGTGGVGLQINLPVSVVLSERFVTHTNVGGTWVPSATASAGGSGPLSAFAAGQSFVWLAHRRVNFLVEGLYTWTEVAGPAGAERTESLTVNPGVRAAFDFASGLQIVPGVSVPIGLGPSRGERGILFYLSFEHPFGPAGSTAEAGSKRS